MRLRGGRIDNGVDLAPSSGTTNLVDFGYTFAGLKLDSVPTVAARQIRSAMEARGVFTRNLKPPLCQRLWSPI